MRHLKLVCNMRAKSDPWFAEYLLCIEEGSEEANGDGEIRLPDDICIPQIRDDSDLDTLIDCIFPTPQCQYVKQELHHLTSNIISAERLG